MLSSQLRTTATNLLSDAKAENTVAQLALVPLLTDVTTSVRQLRTAYELHKKLSNEAYQYIRKEIEHKDPDGSKGNAVYTRYAELNRGFDNHITNGHPEFQLDNVTMRMAVVEIIRAVRNLYLEVQQDNQHFLMEKTDALLTSIFDDSAQDQQFNKDRFDTAIQTYMDDIQQTSAGNKIVRLMIAVAIAAIAFVAGFLIGFALGIWSGPGAVLTGLAAGSSAAIITVGATTVVAGVGATLTYKGLRQCSLFEPHNQRVKDAAENVAEKCRNLSMTCQLFSRKWQENVKTANNFSGQCKAVMTQTYRDLI